MPQAMRSCIGAQRHAFFQSAQPIRPGLELGSQQGVESQQEGQAGT